MRAMSRVLVENSLGSVTIDDADHVVTVARTPAPLDVDLLKAIAARLRALVPTAQRRDLGIIFDVRHGPLSNPELEQQLFAAAAEMRSGFRVSATVVSTAVGKLQASRIQRESLVALGFLSTDLAEARAHVLAELRRARAGAG